MSSIVGRAIIVTKTNKSGGALAKGDVVIVDASNDNAVTTTTSGATTVTVGVVVEENGIANNASGRVQFGGHCGLVTPNASVTRGHYAATHTVAKQCADAGASRVVGTFGIFTTGGTTPEIDLFSQPDAASASGNVATDALWDAKGDLAVGTGANTAAKLTIGANDTIPMADSGETTGIKWVASATPSTQAFGDSAAAGTADTFTRGDHKHGMPAALTSAKYVRTSGDYVISSAGWAAVDGTNMALTITTGAHRVLVTADITAYYSNGALFCLDVDIDGSRVGDSTSGLVMNGVGTNVSGNLSFSYLTDVLSAGSHTFTLYRAILGGTSAGHIYGGSGQAVAVFAVMEQGG